MAGTYPQKCPTQSTTTPVLLWQSWADAHTVELGYYGKGNIEGVSIIFQCMLRSVVYVWQPCCRRAAWSIDDEITAIHITGLTKHMTSDSPSWSSTSTWHPHDVIQWQVILPYHASKSKQGTLVIISASLNLIYTAALILPWAPMLCSVLFWALLCCLCVQPFVLVAIYCKVHVLWIRVCSDFQ